MVKDVDESKAIGWGTRIKIVEGWKFCNPQEGYWAIQFSWTIGLLVFPVWFLDLSDLSEPWVLSELSELSGVSITKVWGFGITVPPTGQISGLQDGNKT